MFTDVCVIVPTFNRAGYLRYAIESILGQSRPPADVIVVDDGSTDDTPAVAMAFGNRIRYVRKSNSGKPAAVNLASRMARSEYLIIADDDDIMHPSGLEHLLTPLECDSQLCFASGGLTFFRDSPDGKRIEVSAPPVTRAEVGHHFQALLMNYSMNLNATLMRRRCFEAMGGLDESFRRSEDYEFMLRLTRSFKGISIAQRIIDVRRHEGMRGDAQIRHSARERQLVHFDYDARAFEKLRREATIGEYIGKPDGPLNAQEHCDAWFRRAAAMARHGVWQGFRDDIREFGRRFAESRQPITKDMATTLSRVFSRADTIEAGLRNPGYPGWVVNEFTRALGRGATRPIVRGLYYAARDAYTDGYRWLAIRCIGFAAATVARALLATFRSPK